MNKLGLPGVYELTPDDELLVNKQKALTKAINERLVQVGAVFLKPASRMPIDDSWYQATKGVTDLQSWIDDESLRACNVGFNTQLGWMDIDIDGPNAEFLSYVGAALEFNGCETRFRFGRRSNGHPSHFFVLLSEDEAINFSELAKFAPPSVTIKGERHHVELRSTPVNTDAKNLIKMARQVVMPGSVYGPDKEGQKYDLSVWYNKSNGVATDIKEIATTTARTTTFFGVVRAIAMAYTAYVLRDHWVEGNRQNASTKLTGWLARLVADCRALNEHEAVSREIVCPIDEDSAAENLIRFICQYYGDDEAPMRVRTYYDAVDKLSKNPDAKIPGWSSFSQMIGADAMLALRAVMMPGADVSSLTRIADRYIYDETDNSYIDRERHSAHSSYVHEGQELERRHRGDVIFVAGKPKEAFKIFESSNLRKRVDARDMFPDIDPGSIFRINSIGQPVPDEYEDDAYTVFNTWQGWQIQPVGNDKYSPKIMEECVASMDKMFGLLTCDKKSQVEWLKKWIAWTRQNPGQKQQVAPVIIGGMGVGKSFWGNIFMKAVYGSRLWGTASPKIVDDKFNISPFLGKMFVFIDEAKFTGDSSTEEIKKLIRNTEMSGMEKFSDARDYRVFARLAFASNKFDNNIAQRNVEDRALYYMRAVNPQYLDKSEPEFKEWALGLKPFYDQFAAMLQDPVKLGHIVRYFCELPCSRHELEDISTSSGRDADVISANISWARRVAKNIIESGYIASRELTINIPFTHHQLATRVEESVKELGIRGVMPDAVVQEFINTGVFGTYFDDEGMRYMRFMRRWGEVVDAFQTNTGLLLETYRRVNESDYGPNECTPRSNERRTSKASLSGF